MAGTGSTQPAPGEARLIPLGSHAGSPPISIKRPATLIGSRKDIARIHLESSTVSNAHAVLVLNETGCYIHDLGSRTGVWVNGQKVVDADLKDGDALQIGRFSFQYQSPAGAKGKFRAAASAELSVSTLTDPLPLNKRVIQIGRRRGSDLQFDDDSVSNVHAILFTLNGKWCVRDINSRTGTWLGGKPIHQEVLADGASLRIGPATIVFNEVASPMAPAAGAALVPLAEVAPAPQIERTVSGEPTGSEALDIEALALDSLTTDTEQTDDEIAAELAKEAEAPEPSVPLELDLEPEVEPVSDAAGAGISQPEAPADDLALPLADAVPVADEPEIAAEIEPTKDGTDTIAEEDAMASLRRGWHGPRATEPEAEAVEAPPVEAAAPAPLPLEDEPVQIDLEPEAEIELPPAIALDAPIDIGAPTLDEAPVDEEPAEAVAEEPAPLESAPALLPVEDVSDDDGAIDLPDAAPAPVAGAIVEPELTLESDDAGLDEPAPVAETPVEPTAEAPVEPVAELSELEAIELESPEATRETGDAELLADESEDEIDVAAGVPEAAAPVATDAEASEAVVAEPLPELSAPTLDAASGEPSASDTLATVNLEEAAEAVAAPIDEAPSADAAPSDHVSGSEASEALFDQVVSEAESAESLDSIDDWLNEAEAEVDATVAEGVDIEAATPAPTEPVADEPVAEEPIVDEPVADEPVAAIDLSADLDRDTAGAEDETTLGVAPVGLDAAPTPVPDLEGVDFSDLTIADDAGQIATPEARSGAPVTGPKTPAPETSDPVELDLTVFTDAADESSATPLLNLADSVEGDDVFSPLDSASGTPVEVIEETLPTPASAMPEFDTDTLAARDSLELVDEVDLRELDAEEEVDHAGLDTAMDVTPLVSTTDDHDFEGEVETPDLPTSDRRAPAAAMPGLISSPPDEPFEPLPENQAPPPRQVQEAVARADAPDDFSPPSEGKLSDLIPAHGPMVGGAFTPMPQQFLVGGSSLVELPSAELPAQPEAKSGDAPARSAPPFGAPDAPDRRRPLRVGFGGTAAPAPQASPFAGARRTIAEALVGRTGQRSVDVFANPSPTPEDLLLDHPEQAADAKKPENGASDKDALPSLFGGSAEERELQETADRFRPRGSIGALSDFPQIPASRPSRPEDDPVFVAKLRKSRLRRVLACVILMVPLIGGAVAGVYHFVPVTAQLDAVITFNGLDRISPDDRRDFKAVQTEYLRSPGTLADAVTELGTEVPKGFLSDLSTLNDKLAKDPKDRWPENNLSAMRLRLKSTDKENDRIRLEALANAIIKANEPRTRKANELRNILNNTQAMIQTRIIRRDALNDEIRQIQNFGDAVATQAELDQAKTVRTAKENDLKAARTKRMDIESAIQLLQSQTPSELAPSPVQQLAEQDEALKKLNEELASLQKETENARAKVASENEKARKSLDDVITQLEKELESAQKLKDNPELVKYVTGAKSLFAKTRTLTDELLQKQVDQFDRLNELKTRLEERIDAHRRNTLASDPELKKMSAELAMLSRQHNSASQDYPEEAKKLDLKMKHLQSLIAGREEALNKDPLYAQVITDLQSLVETTAKNIRDDRKHVDDSLTKAQEEFQASTPAVEKMPAEQKALAEAIEKKLNAVTEARKAYSQSADAAEAEQAKREKELKEKMATVQQSIFSRKQIVEALAQEQQAETAEANRKKRLEEKKLELVSAQEQEKLAQEAFEEAEKKIASMNEARRTRQDNELARDTKVNARDELEREIQKLNTDLAHKSRELAGIVVPEEKVEVVTTDDPDRRPMFMGVGAASMFVLMLIPIVWNLRLISRDSHPRPAPVLPVASDAPGFAPVLADEVKSDDAEKTSPDDTHTPEDEPATVR